jgi:hypothetical protein
LLKSGLNEKCTPEDTFHSLEWTVALKWQSRSDDVSAIAGMIRLKMKALILTKKVAVSAWALLEALVILNRRLGPW